MRKAKVYVDDYLAGILIQDNGFKFQYLKSYIENPNAKPVSLTLPITNEVYESPTLFPFFDGLIPEGWLLELIIKQWGIDRRDRMGLLLKTGYNTIGNVSVEEVNE